MNGRIGRDVDFCMAVIQRLIIATWKSEILRVSTSYLRVRIGYLHSIDQSIHARYCASYTMGSRRKETYY